MIILLLSFIILGFGIQQTAFGTQTYVNSLGDEIRQLPALQSIIFEENNGFINSRVASCVYEDSQLGLTQVVRNYVDDGWNLYQSCRGFMNHYDCTTIDEREGVSCTGDIGLFECASTSECDSGEVCIGGVCESGLSVECSTGYMCDSGAIFYCKESSWSLLGSCGNVPLKDAQCKNNGERSGDYRSLCQDETVSDPTQLTSGELVFRDVISESKLVELISESDSLICRTDNGCGELERCINNLCVPALQSSPSYNEEVETEEGLGNLLLYIILGTFIILLSSIIIILSIPRGNNV